MSYQQALERFQKNLADIKGAPDTVCIVMLMNLTEGLIALTEALQRDSRVIAPIDGDVDDEFGQNDHE